MSLKCNVCAKEFDTRNKLSRHSLIHGNGQKRTCSKCSKVLSRPEKFKKHRCPTEKTEFPCNTCGKVYKSPITLRNHAITHHRPKIWRPWESTPAQDSQLPSFHQSALEEDPIDPQVVYGPLNDDDYIKKLIANNWNQVRTHSKLSNRLQDRFVIRFSDHPTKTELLKILDAVKKTQRTRFKLNIAFGFILREKLTDELVLYYASNNNKLFPSPVVIANQNDIYDVVSRIDKQDILEYCRSHRPNTRFAVEKVTNILITVNKLKDYPIGCSQILPDYISKLRSIISFNRDHRGRPYEDNFCLMRCLAYHRGYRKTEIDREAEIYAHIWCAHQKSDPSTFPGVKLSELGDFQRTFQVDIEVYSIYETKNRLDQPKIFASKRFSTTKRPENSKMAVCLYSNHFFCIKRLSCLAPSWECSKCRKLFNRRSKCVSHQRNCSTLTKYLYPGGGYSSNRTFFDDLEDFGIHIEEYQRFYPFVVTYDFEAMFQRTESSIIKGVSAELIPISVSVCSNVPGHQKPTCFISDGSCEKLMITFVQYLVKISKTAQQLMFNRYRQFTNAIEEKISQMGNMKSDPNHFQLNRLYVNFKKWLHQMVVLGFNSGRFDINLIRRHFFPALLSVGLSIKSVLKRHNDYLSIGLDDLLFLDIKNYLAPHTSYAAWLKSSDINATKGVFPYEWLQSIQQLDYPQLPDHSAFYSTLRQSNISIDDYNIVQEVWRQKGFTCIRDYLEWYNNLDVEPFVHAAEKLSAHWRSLGIDAFKGGHISLPGLSLAHLMKTLQPHVVLPLFSYRHKHLHELIRENVVGGLSIVIHRYHETGKTALENGQICRKIYSHDANSLYLYALAKETGTGVFAVWSPDGECESVPGKYSENESPERWHSVVHRNGEVQFKRQLAYTFFKRELEWIEWMTHVSGQKIRHKFNGGQKIFYKSSTEKYPVDGYVSSTKTIFQFHGCGFHGHFCEKDGVKDVQRRQQTEEITAFLRSLGNTVIDQWECEWEQKRKTDEIRSFLRDHVNLPKHYGHMTTKRMIKLISEDKFFGMVECDAEIPRWDPDLQKKFADFPPFFKRAEVSKDDIGLFMRKYAEDNNLLSNPRKLLISSYFVEKQLIGTPYLKWLLAKGAVVTRIYLAIEQKPKTCFAHLADEVAHHRRLADQDERYTSNGETWKLTGNNYYGKTITDKRRHKDHMIVGEESAARLINNKLFHELEEISTEGLYEVGMDKGRIKMDLPITVAFYVYANAKLRVLEFVYDFLQYYLIPGTYKIVCSDTDSIVAAYASENIDDLVKPELLHEYHSYGKRRFLVTNEFDLRTPGLFKVEWKGNGIVALCSKTYYTWDDEEERSSKISCKGLSKVTNKFGKEDFLNVLTTQTSGSGTNYGFKVHRDGLFQYKQDRKGISYLYVKRCVLEDGITTKPLYI